MELWIRSQDRMKLCNAKVFSLDNDQTGIFCNSCEDSYVFAGKYKTKERALEVLDEIQYYIQNQGKTFAVPNKNGIIIDYKYCGSVYEMPKE